MPEFLPISRADMQRRGWEQCDFVYIIGDGYVDHPSFGHAIISRVLEDAGYKVGIISQPDWKNPASINALGEPRLGFLVMGGNMDSMVNHYTVSKAHRKADAYTPGGVMGKRPDYAVTVYCNLIRRTYRRKPIIIGGIEASLRRLAHYDYWSDKRKRSILLDSQADLLIYGMGERAVVEIANALNDGMAAQDITYIDGTVYKTREPDTSVPSITLPAFPDMQKNPRVYAESFSIQYRNTDPFCAKRLIEPYGDHEFIVQNPPQKPLSQKEMDHVYDLPYCRTFHPSYKKLGGIPAIAEIEFSLTSCRGCFGACSFCALTFHQGRIIQTRSQESIIKEAEGMTHSPGFKGYIHDVGGPTANFRQPACKKQLQRGACPTRQCLFPSPCKNLIADHTDYLSLLRKLRKLPGVKKVFIRSGIRFDYLMADPDDTFFKELVEYHVSGQLKVAPEHCAPNTLAYMGKPPIQTFNKFKDKFYELSKKAGKKQYLVPYLMSSHPGSTLNDAVYLAEYLYKNHMRPEQVQDFYPTPGTVSTCMFYTGLDPYTLKPVFVEKTAEGKALQRALLQYYEPRNAEKVIKALKMTHREDLIPLLVPAEGRRAVQRSARRAEAAEVTIHNDGTYTVRPNGKGGKGKTANRAAAPAGRQPSPGARFAPHAAPGHKPKNNQQKENTTWKTTKRKK